MARPANQASGSGTTNKPKVKKPAAKKPAAPGLYGWNGGPKTHTISQADHDMHVADPLTKDPLYASAKQQATAQYAPQVNALTGLQTSAPVWYQNYMNQAKAAGVASAAYAQPVIAQAGTFAQNVNAPAAGLDPNSSEYARSVQAGKGLSALATFGQQNLQANQAADQTYFGGQATNAAAALPGVLAGYATQQGQLGSQVAGKTQELYQGLKQAAVNEDIARSTLNLNAANTATDNAQNATNAKQQAKDRAASRDVQIRGQDISSANRTASQQAAAEKTATAEAKKTAAAKVKKTATIQKAVSKARQKVSDIEAAWVRGGTMPAPTTKDPNARRPATREELRHNLRGQYGATWVSIMERVRKGQAITQDQIDYLHGLDPDFRVPKDWKLGKPRAPISRPGNAPGDVANGGQQRPT